MAGSQITLFTCPIIYFQRMEDMVTAREFEWDRKLNGYLMVTSVYLYLIVQLHETVKYRRKLKISTRLLRASKL